jgi:hypothetical protein
VGGHCVLADSGGGRRPCRRLQGAGEPVSVSGR